MICYCCSFRSFPEILVTAPFISSLWESPKTAHSYFLSGIVSSISKSHQITFVPSNDSERWQLLLRRGFWNTWAVARWKRTWCSCLQNVGFIQKSTEEIHWSQWSHNWLSALGEERLYKRQWPWQMTFTFTCCPWWWPWTSGQTLGVLCMLMSIVSRDTLTWTMDVFQTGLAQVRFVLMKLCKWTQHCWR